MAVVFIKFIKRQIKGLEWHKDADKYGNFIINKHKSDVGFYPMEGAEMRKTDIKNARR